jgi:peptidoglycan/LPS O-acetylase OafA/YrhL
MLVLAFLSWHLVEKPAMSLKHRSGTGARLPVTGPAESCGEPSERGP